jgi:hypothetical protein
VAGFVWKAQVKGRHDEQAGRFCSESGGAETYAQEPVFDGCFNFIRGEIAFGADGDDDVLGRSEGRGKMG